MKNNIFNENVVFIVQIKLFQVLYKYVILYIFLTPRITVYFNHEWDSEINCNYLNCKNLFRSDNEQTILRQLICDDIE